MEKETKNKARPAPLEDSEGNKVVTTKAEEPKEEETLNAAAKEAVEAENAAAEAEADAAKQHAENEEAFRAFLEARQS